MHRSDDASGDGDGVDSDGAGNAGDGGDGDDGDEYDDDEYSVLLLELVPMLVMVADTVLCV
jgi:hypothetical protein